MEENKTTQTEVIGEKQLEDVSGGVIVGSERCWFLPQEPVDSNFKVENNKVFAKCRSTCSSGVFHCKCYGVKERCVDKYHLLEHVMGDIWRPAPSSVTNHSLGDKAVRGIKVDI